MWEIITKFEKDTERLGQKTGKLAWPGMIILLRGDLGTGKTVLTRGIARGLGIEEPVTSPTYTLIHQYDGRLPLYHFDIYRLGDAEEMYDLGYEEFFYGQGVSVVEWPERMEDLGPNEYLEIRIDKKPLNREEERIIRVFPIGEEYEKFVKDLMDV